MGEQVIREMKSEDYKEMRRLWEETPGIRISDADSAEKVTSFLERNPGCSFVLEDGARIAGTILGGHDGRRGYLHHLVVREEYRRQGWGRSLISHCLEKLGEAGIKKCHLFVMADNLPGLDFWIKSGWQKREDILILSREIAKSAIISSELYRVG